MLLDRRDETECRREESRGKDNEQEERWKVQSKFNTLYCQFLKLQ